MLVFAIGANTANSLGGNFEIDGGTSGANLKVDGQPPAIDWASVNENRQNDRPTGQNDDSYQGGVKEDTACPGETTGSIPNNKSDLLSFGAYVETETDGPGWLNLFWSRVNNPSGTTLMDFELNQSNTNCSTGPNKQRTLGDLLIEYAIDQGGAVATITAREWNGSAWGPATGLPNDAIGTINLTTIPAAESDGLITTGSLAARTFGEMALDLDFIFDEEQCESFGSAMLKSRSSDSFSSQLKDFIRPVPVNITNCGSVIIRKQTDPDEDPNVTEFGYTKSFSTDPATGNTFTLTDDDSETFNNVLIGDDYTVVEDDIPSGWDFDTVDCSASTGVTVDTSAEPLITFDIDNSTDVVDCTYYNKARGTIIVEKITSDGFGSFDFTSGTLSPSPFTLTTTAPGAAGKDSETFSNLVPGSYDVAETVPAGWNLDSFTCDDGSTPLAINLAGGETVTCTATNSRQRGAIDIEKLRKHAADGPGDHPQAGVDFTVYLGNDVVGSGTTDSTGHACVSGLLLSSFNGGTPYTVVEDVPAGYNSADDSQDVSVTAEESGCETEPDNDDADVTFHNIPLTDVTVSVDSQVDGGTASTIDCDGTTGSTDEDGDGSVTVEDLEPTAPAVTLTCTITVDP